ncbi:hypothetical protein GC167_06315 [bacterium]|nr:hypothetical protein [bacterium]
MKRFFVGLLAMSLSLTAAAQSEMEVIRSVFKMEKRQALEQVLKLSATEAELFWPMYTEYENKMAELGNQRIALIKDYAMNYQTLTDEKAAELAGKMHGLRKSREDLAAKYMKKAKKSIGGIKAATWYQFESYVTDHISVELSEEIPFIGEL